MGLFDGVFKKEEKQKPKPKQRKAQVREKVEGSVPSDVDVIPLEEDVIAKEIVRPQIRYVKKIIVMNYSDLERVSEELQQGNLVLVDLSALESRPEILEKIVEQIKGMVSAVGGTAAKICKKEIKLLLTPSDVKIAK
ncbi:MAG: cell division protein SepF [Thermococci archaeon]|nr:cell division protein SepF [Thermococci archaeon]